MTRLSLNRLSRASVEAIVTRLGGAALPAHTRAAIVAQTDGVPLFVEELTKAVLETGEAAIPASLHGSLMARLDRIPEVKEVAQIAACIGREFDQALVQAWPSSPRRWLAAIDKLAAAELIFRRGTPPNPRFTFKHALVQEAAYEHCCGQGREQHPRAASRQRWSEISPNSSSASRSCLAPSPDRRPAITERAIEYWLKAGRCAARDARPIVEAIGTSDARRSRLARGTARRRPSADGREMRAAAGPGRHR